MALTTDNYWSCPVDTLFTRLACGGDGLTEDEAERRLREQGPNSMKGVRDHGTVFIFLQQFKSPITLLLIASALLSFFLGEKSDAYIILAIILVSALLGFYQEYSAAGALKQLLQMVQVKTTVVRDGKECSIPQESVVAGDTVLLSAGNTIPGDCRLLDAKDLFTNEASLTGETFPVEKNTGVVPESAGLSVKTNVLFMGTHVISGTAKALVVHTGLNTEFGAISKHLGKLQPETEFDRGIRRFGYLLLEVTLMLVVIIFLFNVLLDKPVLDSFLFSLAIAVGLTPQLLPAIISINLSKGAFNMAKQQVIVKRLSSIENFGSMDILCSDKTGTLTRGEVALYQALNAKGSEDPEVFRMAWLNAYFEKGFTNPIDKAILAAKTLDVNGTVKKDELPYDFIRKRLSVLVESPDAGGKALTLITKGAFDNVISVCSNARMENGAAVPIGDVREDLSKLYTSYSEQGYRVLGISGKKVDASVQVLTQHEETGMTFMGMLLLTDPPKEGVRETLNELSALGISLKIITGDNPLVARQVSRQVGLENPVILTGAQIKDMTIESLSRRAGDVHIFAAVEPNQKEKILMALKKAGHVVGFMGDGINDAPALHAADVGISVNNAADVAREASDIILLGSDLAVLIQGVKEGRKTFANTLKYIFMATSANFGNMFSMAGASIFLPFLPLLPKQVLLTNLLTDIPEMTIATDRVDPNMTAGPRRIDLAFIRRFMIVFGLISSIFDYATFFVLLLWLKASPAEFQTGWFLESVISAVLIVLVVRTSRPFYKNRPGRYLLISSIGIIVVTLLLPMLPLNGVFGFARLPWRFFPALAVIIAAYIITAETAKHFFYKKRNGSFQSSRRAVTHV